jgi:two-component system response regulator PilR (NtrC family)
MARGEEAVKASILLVEDEPAIQLAMKGLLRHEGHTVRVVSAGGDALRALDEEEFDVVLTDFSLPDGINGLDVVRHARSLHDTPVILLTAFDSEEMARDAVAAGAFDFVPKPFDNQQVRDMVRRALRSS